MAHFYATIQGNRKLASRLGTKSSGITAKVNGWDVGVKIELDFVDGRDVLRIY